MKTWQDRFGPKLEVVLINLFSYLLFLALAIVVIWPQLKTKAFISGTDSIFHMNRFYETMMQFKTGHFSYFQSIFGYHQIGRIVNAFYGPILAYLSGLVLLIAGSWYHFQITMSLVVLSLSGWFMYLLCTHNQVKRLYALIIAGLYMTCYPISLWVIAQEFTGWGATFMPLLMLCGTDMLRHHRIKCLPLAISMSVLLQTHVLSSLIGCAALIPFFIVGWRFAAHRILMLFNAVKAFGLTILLTSNVWGGMVDLFSNNYIMPVFPQKNLVNNAVSIQHFSLVFLGPVFTILVGFVVINLLINWRKESLSQKTIDFTGLFFFWLSSRLFPWQLIRKVFPPFTNVIQFPMRFLVIPCTLLLLSLGMTLSRQPFLIPVSRHHFSADLRVVKIVGMILLLIASVNSLSHIMSDRSKRFYSNSVTNQSMLMVHRYTSSNQKLRRDFYSHDLKLSLLDMDKPTPDYLPLRHALKNDNEYYQMHPYHLVQTQLNHNPGDFKKRVEGLNRLKVIWVNHALTLKRTTLPLVVYHGSIVSLNHRILSHPKLSSVGAVQVLAKPGKNVVTLKYQPDLSMQSANLIAMVSWLFLLVNLIIRQHQIKLSNDRSLHRS